MGWISDSTHNNIILSFFLILCPLVSLQSNNSQSRAELLNEIIILYNKALNTGKKVTITWCTAHIGISGNEQADRAAKVGLNLSQVTAELY